MIAMRRLIFFSVAEGTDELWRDHSGFVVGDKQRFAEFEVEK